MSPKVSAIMPTRARHKWAAEACQMFTEQIYANRELVIIDDWIEPSFPAGSKPFVYVSTRNDLSIGAKRNLACEYARGEIICHWDSDDFYSPDRIAHQVEMLLAHPEAQIAGYNEMEFVDEEIGARYLYRASPGDAIGVSMCYRRSEWVREPFRDLQEGEDSFFKRGRSVYTEPAGGRIVARIHSGNTSEKRIATERNPVQWKKL